MALSDDEINARIDEMKEGELLEFIRDTVSQLEVLADRLEGYANDIEENPNESASAASLLDGAGQNSDSNGRQS